MILDRKFLAIVILLSVLWSIRTAETPDLVLVISRHGARAPKDSKYDSSWGNQYGQLTRSGIRQQYLLGAALAAKYNGKALQNYSRSSVYLRAHAQNLTVQSMHAQSIGLFPPGTGPIMPDRTPALNNQIQPLPIHTMNVSTDYLLYAFSDVVCPIQSYLRRKLNDIQAREVMRLIQPTVTKLSQVYGTSLTLDDLSSVYDVLNSNYYENKPFPQKLSFIHYNDNYWKNISFANHWWLFYKDFSLGDQRAIYSVNLLNEITARFNNFLTQPPGSTPTFLSYVGHYSTLAAVLSLFNITSAECLKSRFLGNQSTSSTCYPPDFAASIRFELYRQNNASDSYLKMYYNDDQINLCANNTVPCTVEAFNRTVAEYTGGLNQTDYFEICYSVLMPSLDTGRGIKVLLWVIVGVNMALMLCLFILCSRQVKSKSKKKDLFFASAELKDASSIHL